MKGLLCSTSAKTNDEYRKVIKRRMNIMVLIGLNGAVTLTVCLLAIFKGNMVNDDYMIGVYLGLGTGLIVVSAGLWIRNMLILKNDEKLKESRLVNSDERIQEISNRSFRFAALILIMFMYLGALIGGFFYPVLVKALLFLICVFLLAYTVSYRIYDKRM